METTSSADVHHSSGQAAVDDLYARLLRFCRTTVDRWALSDYFNAVSGRRIGFEGRAQMGGFGATVLLRKYPRGLVHHYVVSSEKGVG